MRMSIEALSQTSAQVRRYIPRDRSDLLLGQRHCRAEVPPGLARRRGTGVGSVQDAFQSDLADALGKLLQDFVRLAVGHGCDVEIKVLRPRIAGGDGLRIDRQSLV